MSIGAIILIVMYAQLLFFQLKTHAHTFNNGGDDSEDGEYCWSFWLEAWMGFVKNSIWGDHLSLSGMLWSTFCSVCGI
ncbi:hypothetical protein HJC23_004125 [Cyclotella cryptica]|uniref:Uncharacterized protein n=1 Tax=Cyclotella cryptica TaxID=29204 RepID=A0ABD3P8J6_9STRA